MACSNFKIVNNYSLLIYCIDKHTLVNVMHLQKCSDSKIIPYEVHRNL